MLIQCIPRFNRSSLQFNYSIFWLCVEFSRLSYTVCTIKKKKLGCECDSDHVLNVGERKGNQAQLERGRVLGQLVTTMPQTAELLSSTEQKKSHFSSELISSNELLAD